MKIIVALIVFSVIILFHELGHFLLAKANGIRVNEFCLGMGPTLIGFTKGDTTYSLKLFPIGGACMMEGEDEESSSDRSFGKKAVWARISVVAAGPLFNFIMAFFFAFVLNCNTGYDLPVLSGVQEGYPAQEAGMQEGDVIVKMNRSRIHFFREISAYTQFHPGETVDIVYERDGERRTVRITPKLDEEKGYYMYGFLGSTARKPGSLFDNLKYSVYEVKYWISVTLNSLKALVTGKVSIKQMSGPVGIVDMIGEGYEKNIAYGWFSVFLQMLYMSIFLSANLGVMNLLPLPALDGGRLLFLFAEVIRGRRVDPEKEGMVHFIGIMLLFAFMIFVVINDVRRLMT